MAVQLCNVNTHNAVNGVSPVSALLSKCLFIGHYKACEHLAYYTYLFRTAYAKWQFHQKQRSNKLIYFQNKNTTWLLGSSKIYKYILHCTTMWYNKIQPQTLAGDWNGVWLSRAYSSAAQGCFNISRPAVSPHTDAQLPVLCKQMNSYFKELCLPLCYQWFSDCKKRNAELKGTCNRYA